MADNRTFTEEEDSYFSDQAQYAYESFRNKAALSRGMQNEQMQEFAQVSLQTNPIHSKVLICLHDPIKAGAEAMCERKRCSLAVTLAVIPQITHLRSFGMYKARQSCEAFLHMCRGECGVGRELWR